MADAPRHGRPVWSELLTTDMKAAEKFYTAVVGWTVKPFDQSPQQYDMWVRPGGIAIGGVLTIPPGMNFPPHWEMYVAVSNLEDTIARIERLGGKILGPLIDVPDVGRKRTMVDAQGAVFAIIEPAPRSPDAPEVPAEVGDASWRELHTLDAAAAMTFYSDLFGWRETSVMDMGPMGKYHIFGRQFDLGGIMKKHEAMANVPPHWMIYFRVPNVQEAVDRVKANGGQTLNGPMEVPGGDWIINCMDPQGGAFSLHQKKAG
jgi:predicted enzyme related to lactoylglutathione lyase